MLLIPFVAGKHKNCCFFHTHVSKLYHETSIEKISLKMTTYAKWSFKPEQLQLIVKTWPQNEITGCSQRHGNEKNELSQYRMMDVDLIFQTKSNIYFSNGIDDI